MCPTIAFLFSFIAAEILGHTPFSEDFILWKVFNFLSVLVRPPRKCICAAVNPIRLVTRTPSYTPAHNFSSQLSQNYPNALSRRKYGRHEAILLGMCRLNDGRNDGNVGEGIYQSASLSLTEK